MPPTQPRALGRPPLAVSADTRDRIIRAAQRRFARDGFDKTTNKDIAGEAGLTPGALYHYFESKQQLYVAVLVDELQRVLRAFRDAADGVDGAVAQLHAVLDRAIELHRGDESLAKFHAVAPIEIERHPELQRLLAQVMPDAVDSFRRFFGDIVAAGQARGELDDRPSTAAVVTMLTAVTQGLAQLGGLVGGPAHERAVDAFKRLLEGSLVRAPAPPAASRRRLPIHAR